MKFCQAYGCEAKATCHGVLCDRHIAMVRPSLQIHASNYKRAARFYYADAAVRDGYVAAQFAMVGDVNRQLTPPAGAVAARPEPKGPAGSFAGSAFSTKPPRNRVEEI